MATSVPRIEIWETCHVLIGYGSMKLSTHFTTSKLLKIIFVALLVIATHQSLVPRPASVFESWSDKHLHMIGWGVLSIALCVAFPKIASNKTPVLLLFGYATVIEIGQIFVPGRFCSWLDMIANGIGCGLVYLGVHLLDSMHGTKHTR